MRSQIAALTFVLGLGASSLAFAQGTPPPAPTHPLETSLEYQLGPGDLLSIKVSGVKEFEQRARVSNSGRIHVPFVGVLFVAGLTPIQIEKDVSRLIKEHELVNEPLVRIQIEEYRARPTYVVGEVAAPGQFAITREMFLLDVIGKAGGLLTSADDTAFLYRRRSAQPQVQAKIIDPASADKSGKVADVFNPATAQTASLDQVGEEVIRVNLRALKEGTQPKLNLKLQGGDVLVVPRRLPQNVYIIGDVKVPGAYTMPRSGTVTAVQAIIYAGGPGKTASNGKAFIMRHDAAGVRQALPVDFPEIVAGKQPDVPVLADDIIFIPTSPVKTVTTGLMQMLPELVNQILIF